MTLAVAAVAYRRSLVVLPYQWNFPISFQPLELTPLRTRLSSCEKSCALYMYTRYIFLYIYTVQRLYECTKKS